MTMLLASVQVTMLKVFIKTPLLQDKLSQKEVEDLLSRYSSYRSKK